jgi:hypothetical protein
MTLFAVLAMTVQGQSQKITTFDVPGAGTGAGTCASNDNYPRHLGEREIGLGKGRGGGVLTF